MKKEKERNRKKKLGILKTDPLLKGIQRVNPNREGKRMISSK